MAEITLQMVTLKHKVRRNQGGAIAADELVIANGPDLDPKLFPARRIR